MDKTKSKSSVRSLKKKVNHKSQEKTKQKSNANKDKKIEKNKKQMYTTSSSQTVLKDMKNSAISSINSFRNTFDILTNKFKVSSNTSGNQLNGGKSYHKFNGFETPTQLYSPFGIESPSPRVDRKPAKRSCCRQMFFSPTQKIKDDVLYLNNGIKELNLVSEGIENRMYPSDSNQSLI